MIEAVNLHVVPSQWIAPKAYIAEPYERVVGVERSNGDTLWASPTHHGDPEAEYCQQDARERVIRLESIYCDRFDSFFERFITYGTLELDEYNCHRFADWMAGIEQLRPDDDSGQKHAQAIMAAGRILDGNLAAGQRGVFGGPAETGWLADHSGIGLGEDQAVCLQVMHTAGHMGIASYDSLLRALPGSRVSTVAEYGIYVANSPQTQVVTSAEAVSKAVISALVPAGIAGQA
jgi:hypothetical protein